jgi:RNA polymerase sigma-70 factor (ECF subfamily)
MFVAALSDADKSRWRVSEELELELSARAEAARQDWPNIALPPERLMPYWAERLPESGVLDDLATSDLFLACACALLDPQALVSFEKNILPSLDPVLRRIGLQPSDVDEVKQRLRSSLFVAEPGERPEIADFKGHGPLVGWLRVRAARLALKLGRAKTVMLASDDAVFEAVSDNQNLELAWVKQEYRPAVQGAFEEALRSLGGREQNLLRQHFVDRLSIDELGRLYRVHRATAARWIAAARKELLARTRTALQARLQISTSECDSLIRHVRSHLDVSLRFSLG